MNDDMGDRLKGYEKVETGRKFMPMVPVYCRIDGRGFSKFTRGMERPYDIKMSEIMEEVTKYLVQETNARTGYTQSDEISLCWHTEEYNSEIFFGGKIQKMVSTLSALATAKFVELALKAWPERCAKRLPTFDARVFQVPNEAELANCFLWRVRDAVKNSIQMTAQENFSHKELQGKNQSIQLIMLETKGIVWGNYPRFFKEGTFIKRQYYFKHTAQGSALRTRVVALDVPRFDSIENKAEFLLTKTLEHDCEYTKEVGGTAVDDCNVDCM
ncbi:tRNA-His guanylyltransferase [Vibrio phage D148]